jgi:hypothetical protein
VIQKVLDRVSVAFAGAVLGFLVAEHAFGAKGLDRPENLAYGGLILTAGALGFVRMTVARPRSQDADHSR